MGKANPEGQVASPATIIQPEKTDKTEPTLRNLTPEEKRLFFTKLDDLLKENHARQTTSVGDLIGYIGGALKQIEVTLTPNPNNAVELGSRLGISITCQSQGRRIEITAFNPGDPATMLPVFLEPPLKSTGLQMFSQLQSGAQLVDIQVKIV